MPVYSVTRKADGAEVHRYAAAGVIEGAYPLATHDHNELPPDGVEPAYSGPWTITKLGFRQRFTQAEKVAIEIASLDNPAADMSARANAAALRAYLSDVQAATFIDLRRSDTRAGVQTLEALGLLAAGRAAVILDTELAESEVYRG